MAFKKDTKIKSNFQKITIGLASPEEILENSFGEVICSASASSVLPRTMSVPAVSTSASVIRVSSATVVV